MTTRSFKVSRVWLNDRCRFPLPSTERGIEGEGWNVASLDGMFSQCVNWLALSPLTPALSPLRGEGAGAHVSCFAPSKIP
jgi:hypothetical protein